MADDDPGRPPDPPLKPADPPTLGAFEIAALLRRALRTSYDLIEKDGAVNARTQATIDALVSTLLAAGAFTEEELADARARARLRIGVERGKKWRGPTLAMPPTPEALMEPPVLLDCAARLSACQAACCRLRPIHLTFGEVADRELAWDLPRPYELPRTVDGDCVNLDLPTLRCRIWEQRPWMCRSYTCAQASDVWQDFGALIPTERVRALSRKGKVT